MPAQNEYGSGMREGSRTTRGSPSMKSSQRGFDAQRASAYRQSRRYGRSFDVFLAGFGEFELEHSCLQFDYCILRRHICC